MEYKITFEEKEEVVTTEEASLARHIMLRLFDDENIECRKVRPNELSILFSWATRGFIIYARVASERTKRIVEIKKEKQRLYEKFKELQKIDPSIQFKFDTELQSELMQLEGQSLYGKEDPDEFDYVISGSGYEYFSELIKWEPNRARKRLVITASEIEELGDCSEWLMKRQKKYKKETSLDG